MGKQSSKLTERPDAERALLGAILAHPPLLDSEGLHEGLFASLANRKIFLAMRELGSEKLDLVTLTDHLVARGLLGAVGGAAYVSELFSSAGTKLSSVRHYVGILSEAAYRRDVLAAAYRAAVAAQTEPDLEKVSLSVGELEISAAARYGAQVLTGADIVRQEIQDFSTRCKGKSVAATFGIEPLDQSAKILRKSVWFVGARPGIGKTSFLMQTALHNAKRGVKTLFVGLEMGTKRLTWRAVAHLSGMPLRRIIEARFEGPAENTAFLEALEWIEKTKDFSLAYHPGPAVREVRQMVRNARQRLGGLDLVCLDYVQLLQSGGRWKSLYEERTEIVRKLVAMAGEEDIALVCGAQLNREAETIRQEDRPRLGELKGTGSLEEEATGVVLLHRWDVYSAQRWRDAEAILAKNQDGRAAIAKLFMDTWTGRFTESLPLEATEEMQ